MLDSAALPGSTDVAGVDGGAAAEGAAVALCAELDVAHGVVLNGGVLEAVLADGAEDSRTDAAVCAPTGLMLARTTKKHAAISPQTITTIGADSLSFRCCIPAQTQSGPFWFTRSTLRQGVSSTQERSKP